MKINYKKSLKIIGITLVSIILLLTALIFSLRIPAVQNFVKDKLIVYLEDKIKTDVQLERVYIDFPNNLVMEKLFIQGEDVDTLLYVNKLDVGLDIWQLLKNKADLNSIDLNGGKANVVRRKDSSFNFDYIINAFASKEEDESPSKPFIISLDKIKLNQIDVSFIDQQAGNSIKVFVNSFDTRVKKFDLDQNSYAIDKIKLDGLKLRLKQDLVQELVKKVDEKVDSLNEKKPMQLALGEIDLSNFDIDYGDDNSQMFAKLKFKELSTTIKKLDLDKNSYAVDGINLSGLDLKFTQKLVKDLKKNQEVVVDDGKSNPLQLALNKIKLKDIKIDYGDDKTKTFAKIDLDELETNINKLDLDGNYYDIDDVIIKNAIVDANLYLDQNNTSSPTSSSKPMTLILDKGLLDEVKVKYNNTAAKPTREGIDFNHLNFSKLNVDIQNFKMHEGQFTGSVKKAEVKENRGLNIQEFRTDFLYAQNNAYLKNLYLKTPRTLLRDEIRLNYNSMNQLTNNPGSATIYANIKNSKIGFADILNLVPTLKNTTPFDKYPNGIVNVNTNIKGKVNDIKIDRLQLSGLDDLKIEASGQVKNAMDFKNLYYDLNIKNFSTSSKTIYGILPRNTIPNNIRIPSKLAVNGKAKGNLEVINTQLNLTSTLGNANVDAKIDMRQKNDEKYDVIANVQRLDVGTLVSNNQIGKVTGKVNIKGKSFDLAKANTSLNGNIKAIDFNNYNYQNIALNGKINKGAFDIQAVSYDPNANLNLVASGVYNKDLTDVKLNGNIDKLDLNKLGFYSKPMILAGGITADFDNLDVDNLNGSLSLENFAISDTKEIFPLQEMFIKAISTADSNKIQLKSQIADAELKGKFKVTQIFGALSESINQYYQFQTTNTKSKLDPNQYFTLNAKVKDDDLIRKFVPELKSFETIIVDADFDADLKKINLNGQIPNLIYAKNSIENGKLTISNDNDQLNFNLNIAALKSESFQLNKVDLSGDVVNNIINLNASTKDQKDVTQFLIAGNVKNLKDFTEISLNPDGLMLNYDQWRVGEDNSIQLKKDGIVANNFRITNNGSEILLQSENEKGSSPLNVSIKDFKIETITEIIKKEDLPASGVINGVAQIRDLNKEMQFDADIKITELEAFGNPVGNITALVKNTSPAVINADIYLDGNNNDLRIKGDYNTKQSAFDLDLAINRLEMKTIQGFAMNAIKDTEGYISGKLDINGSLEQPKIIGKVQFNDVGLTIAETGSNFRKISETINFTNKGIEFNRFKINDNDNNSLTINGDILTNNYRDFNFDLTANGRDFKVVNSEKSNDAIMYGVLAVNANLEIGGNLDLPKVSGSLTVTDNTNFTFVLPQTSPALQDREGIVEFIDQDKISLQETLVTKDIKAETKLKGFDVNVNIEIDKEAKTSIIIDKANGDFVEIQGEARLTGGMDPSGKLTLVGVYQVEKGAYELSVSLIKRRFDIQKGSTITWTGEPTTANLNITALYKTTAAPIDLIEQQLTGLSSSEINMYKQRMPFNTNLILKGELLKPEIKFDITIDDENPSLATSVIDNTKAKLDQLRTDEAEMNKQVFALLILGRFIGENPFQSQVGFSAETMARQSVSNILSQQLNNLAGDLIQGVELDFGLNTEDDYSSGNKNTRTDLNVAVSKRLLDDRLKVSIGSNFGLDGDARQNENMTNIAGDISVDYSISRDGRYMLRAYRKNEYQVALQGQIVETGVGFIITLDYDKFREIFEKTRRNRNYKRTQRTESK